jgi:hypothetical protein
MIQCFSKNSLLHRCERTIENKRIEFAHAEIYVLLLRTWSIFTGNPDMDRSSKDMVPFFLEWVIFSAINMTKI